MLKKPLIKKLVCICITHNLNLAMQSYPASDWKDRKPPLHRPTSFHTSLSALLDRFWDPMLGLCWEFFRAFFALKMRYYLEVVFSSIFDRFWTPSNPQKLSSRCSGIHFLKVFTLLILRPFWVRFWSSNGYQNRAQEAPKSHQEPTQNLSELYCRF